MGTGLTSETEDASVARTLNLLDQLFDAGAAPDVGIRLWEGTIWPDNLQRPTMLVLNHPGALRAMLQARTEVGAGEAFLFDDIDVEGNVEKVFGLIESLSERSSSWLWRLNIIRHLIRLPAAPKHQQKKRGPASPRGRRHSITRDQEVVTYHYDVSNDFYALWLDRNMVYSCAYFTAPEEELDSAQERKLDYICRKMRLQPGQKMLDIGCGWGGLIMHAAQHYGVTAHGITLSQPQADLANERIAEKGLEDRCQVEVKDYREMTDLECYDALVSVGMFEHVGESLLPVYFSQAWQLLKPGGVFLNHGIARTSFEKRSHGPTFSDTYVFPDGELETVNVTLHAAEEVGFEVRDVESLREHYALTLRQWVERLENHHEEALNFVNEPTYRVWRLFMSGAAYGFAHAKLNVYQVLLVRPDERGRSGLPLTRADWYNRVERS